MRRGRCVAAVALRPYFRHDSSDDVPGFGTQSTSPITPECVPRSTCRLHRNLAMGACGVDESTQARTALSLRPRLPIRTATTTREACQRRRTADARLSGPGGFGRPPREPEKLQCWGCPPPHTRALKRPRRHDRLLTHRRGEQWNAGVLLHRPDDWSRTLVNQPDTVGVKSPGTGDKVVTNTSWAELELCHCACCLPESGVPTWQRGADWIKTSR